MTRWQWYRLDQFTPRLLYDYLKMRSEVFVVEQTCTYLDPDGKDLVAHHLLGWQAEQLVAGLRLLPPEISYPQASLGRVCIRARARRLGLGKTLMSLALTKADQLFPEQALRISAQQYLQAFYEEFGFRVDGPGYLEDGIPHHAMVRPPSGI